jgi:predicted hydrocarbon binding protein
MKGIVFNLLESFVSKNFSEETWDQIHEESNLRNQDPYVGPGTYEDEDLLELVGTSNRILETPIPKILFLFGRFCFKPMVETCPQYLKGINSCADFLMIVDQVIHVEIQKLMPNAYLPRVIVTKRNNNTLEVRYESKRKLCGFLEGMITGCAEFFDEEVIIDHPICTHDGYDHCLLTLKITEKL